MPVSLRDLVGARNRAQTMAKQLRRYSVNTCKVVGSHAVPVSLRDLVGARNRDQQRPNNYGAIP